MQEACCVFRHAGEPVVVSLQRCQAACCTIHATCLTAVSLSTQRPPPRRRLPSPRLQPRNHHMFTSSPKTCDNFKHKVCFQWFPESKLQETASDLKNNHQTQRVLNPSGRPESHADRNQCFCSFIQQIIRKDD